MFIIKKDYYDEKIWRGMLMKRVALLIGNYSYPKETWGPLTNPINDINALGQILNVILFDVIIKTDLCYDMLNDEINNLVDSLENGDTLIVFYAGHGCAIDNINYLMPIDAKSIIEMRATSKNDYLDSGEARWICIDELLRKLKFNDKGCNIIMLDACRHSVENATCVANKEFGFSEIKIDSMETIIAYSTSPGCGAKDGKGNSPYVLAVIKHILKRNQTIEQFFKRVRFEVMEATNKQQKPWTTLLLNKEFKLVDNSYFSKMIDQNTYDLMQQDYLYLNKKIKENGLINLVKDKSIYPEKVLNDIKNTCSLYTDRAVDKFIKDFISGIREGIGLIYMLLHDENISIIDICKDKIFIETRFSNKRICIINNDYYSFNDFKSYIKSFKKSDDGCFILTEIGNNKIYTFNSKYIKSDDYIQVHKINVKTNMDDYLLEQMTSVGLDEIKKQQLNEILYKAILNRKNILILGGYNTKKEKLISALSDYFAEQEKISYITDRQDIGFQHGVIYDSSNILNILSCNDSKKIADVVKEKVTNLDSTRIVTYLHDFNMREAYTLYPYLIYSDKKGSIFALDLQSNDGDIDFNLEWIIANFNEYSKKKYNDAINIDVVISMEYYCSIGGYINGIYIKDNKGFKNIFEFKIDDALIGKLNSL